MRRKGKWILVDLNGQKMLWLAALKKWNRCCSKTDLRVCVACSIGRKASMENQV